MANKAFFLNLVLHCTIAALFAHNANAEENINEIDNKGNCVVLVQGSNNKITVKTEGCGGPSETPPKPREPEHTTSGSLRFAITNATSYSQYLKFYSDTRAHVWPTYDRHYTIGENSRYEVSLACVSGEKICFGATAESAQINWGVGYKNNFNCKSCCYYCPSNHDSPPVKIRLCNC